MGEDERPGGDEQVISFSATAEGLLERLKSERPQVAVLYWEHLAQLPPAWEQLMGEAVVVFPRCTEHRQYEQLEQGKYAVHTETFPGGLREFYEGDIWKSFADAFSRQYEKDPKDVRKAIRMATKVFARAIL